MHLVPSTKEQIEGPTGVVGPRFALSLDVQPGAVRCGSEPSV